MGALGNVPELLPACGRFGVEGCRVGVVAGVLGELGAGGAEGVLVERVARLEPVGEPLGELRGRRRRAQFAPSPPAVSRSRASRGRPLLCSSSASRARRRSGASAASAAAAAASANTIMSAVPMARAASISQSHLGARLRARRARGGSRARPRAARSASTCRRAPRATAASRPARSSACSGRPSSASRRGQLLSSTAAGSARPRCSQKAIPSSKSASARAGPWSG